MTCRVADRLPVALRGVGEAVRLDSNAHMTEAYVKYLACVIYIGQALVDDAACRDLWELSLPETLRFFKMASQCLERAAAVVESSLRKRQDDSMVETEDVLEENGLRVLACDGPSPSEQNWADVPPLSAIRSLGQHSGTSTIGDNERDGAFSPAHDCVEVVKMEENNLSSSPDSQQLAVALQKNEQLMKAYQARMKRISDNSSHRSKAHVQVNFMLMRECQENIAIARARQDALLQKMKYRQQRSIAEDAKASSSSSSQTGSEVVVDRSRLCSEIERFEATQAWSRELRAKIFSHPEETLYINDFIIKALSTSNHPLNELLGQLQYDVYQRLLPLSHQNDNRPIEVDLNTITRRQSKRTGLEIPARRGGSTGDSNISTSWPRQPGDSRMANHRPSRVSDDAVLGSVPSQPASGAPAQGSGRPAHLGHRRNVSSGGRLENVVPNLSDPLSPTASLRQQQKSSIVRRPAPLHPLMDEESVSDDNVSEEEDGMEVLSPQQLLARSLSAQRSARASTSLPAPSIERVRSLVSSMCSTEELEAAEGTHGKVQTVVGVIQSYIDQLEDCFMSAYSEMSTPAGRDQCRASIEMRFFPPLWSLLLAAFRQANYPQEKTLAASMTANYGLTTKEMQIQDRFCLLDQPGEGLPQPYQAAVEQLQRITKSYCPLEKLECVVSVSRSICECVEQYWRQKRGKQVAAKYANIGCDDLLPILGYVVVRSALPQLVSECCAMEEFIHEGYLMGEEGYCLTTLQTALTYVTCLAGERPTQKSS